MFREPLKIDARIDYGILLYVFSLLAIGLAALYVALSHDYPQVAWTMLLQQGAWILLGLLVGFITMFFSQSFLWKMTPLLYTLGLGLMVLPLIYYSPDLVASTGAKNWVSINGMTLFQPSEFMKIPYILMLAQIIDWLHKRQLGEKRNLGFDLKIIGVLTLATLPVLLLLGLQHDLGTAMVYLAIFSGMVLIANVTWKIIVPVSAFFTVLAGGFVALLSQEEGRAFLHQLGMPTYQINRILAWLNPFDFAQTTTFQQAQGQIAIGVGGLTGQGYNVSNLQIPVRESDMIFTVIAEDFGLIGGLVLLLLYFLLIGRMVRITVHSRSPFYTYISTGYILMLLFHIFENIGAVTGILPLTGIPLPFISQGGSSIISNLIGIGLILSIAYQNHLRDEEEGRVRPKRRKVVLRQTL
ncbi:MULTISPECIES: FtsW/RodA/SpoVE family cell cycle protein [unclassified Streptococcus]|uniref:FtsW/RodA/SpoVE family cell cycle protein n=1 Tax=unclassified Streptococcus TaxID=2608887 RepID=UPI001071BE1F|nr:MULTISPECIES: FtsW/RodA/SpoVE family cell cycle protein [unclassified Streptococcus]MBF0805914.1 FtsW/RodA/SpoVE family cell cycle protein [Streptococcus sp. 19428wA2_WM07]TFU28532.1 FtsW/RodA/SpoVE family cell cycle protein [Streptococcus sp. WM07]